MRLYGQRYDCNEVCKYAKNVENPHYKFIPMVHRTHYDGSVSHVTGVISISAEEFEAMQWLRVYVRSKMIKHNKDLFESVDDPLALLEKLHIY